MGDIWVRGGRKFGLACSIPRTGRTARLERTWAKHAWAKIWRSGFGHWYLLVPQAHHVVYGLIPVGDNVYY